MSELTLDRQFDLAVARDDARDMKRMEQGPPRFRGCPPICVKENLPSFASKESAINWHYAPKKGNPLFEPNFITKIWPCDSCRGWHFNTKPRPPSGNSSGSGRKAWDSQ